MILLVAQIIEGKHVVLVFCSQVEYRGYFLSFYSRSPMRWCSTCVTIGRMIHSHCSTKFANVTASRQICVTLAEKDNSMQSESCRSTGPPSGLYILRPLVIHWISVSYLFIFLKIVTPVCSTLILSCKNVSIHILCLSVFGKIISGSCFCFFAPKFSEDGTGPTNDILSVCECIFTR